LGVFFLRLEDPLEVGGSQGQGFLLAVFLLPQAFHRPFIGCVDSQMKSPETLDGDYLAGFEQTDHLRDRFGPFNGPARTIAEEKTGPALPACYGLGMKPPVKRILVLLPAPLTHGEGCHARLFPVIGNILDDGVTGAAVRAVDKGVAISPVKGIVHLPQAVVADAHVR